MYDLDDILKVYLLTIHGLFRFHCVSELCISVTSSARTRGQELITPHTRQPASGHRNDPLWEKVTDVALTS